jgi:hypothetical protein
MCMMAAELFAAIGTGVRIPERERSMTESAF